MAQLESGKTYIIENVGVKDYIDSNGSGHTVAEYFIWLSEKIAAGLDIEMQPIIKENNKCFLPLPYINKPTNNRLCLYIGGESLNNIVPKIGYFNGQDYYIESTDELPRIMYDNQNSFIVINDGADSRAPIAKNFLDEDTVGTFVIDTNFLDTYGFYNIAFLANAGCNSNQNQHITEAYASPRVFICDMFNVLTEQHYDGAFTLANPKTDSSLYVGGYVLNNNFGYNQLGYLSTAAIGIDKDGKYCVQGFLPQVFTSDYDNEEIISASMIRIQFGKLKTYYPMYITLGNAIENLINYCDSTNVWDTKENKTWYKNAFKINNKKFTISCSCDRTTFSPDNPQWAVVIERAPDEIDLVPWSTGTDKEIANMINGYYNGKISLVDIQSVWKVGDTRTVRLSAMPATYVDEKHRAQAVEYQILDFNHDNLVTPINGKTKALISIDQKNCLMDKINYDNIKKGHPEIISPKTENGFINATNDNTTRWKNCARRKWCNEIYYNSLPNYLKKLNKKVKKIADNSYTEDNIFLLSEYEVTGKRTRAKYVEGSQYAFYKLNINNRKKLPRFRLEDNNTYSDIWWLRSPYQSETVYWCNIRELLDADMHYTTRHYGLAPAMCL